MQIDKLRGKELDDLFEGMLKLESVEECYHFFDDLCTTNELVSLKQRFQVAKMMKEGYTYSKVQEETGASSATVSRVKRCLDYGSEGYHTIIDRME
ncbi:helix-turn-helix domain-containing protein [Salinicoccus sp. ID82-1]|uniref:YerC/YecD family TrpR-related protein n=1 Tax=Salinicoccus sp. ID82-1 TaxID=2820269 RepID=UPI001F1EF196|nr:YerC/YecD family TrpR-related protein [Salinicoccus sp. ID82-1]MCG1009534.1 helix-turn-helix domain-containing protein [Salinicoccus sp. ID82-1]